MRPNAMGIKAIESRLKRVEQRAHAIKPDPAEQQERELVSLARGLIEKLIERRGISEAEARQVLASRAPTLASYLPLEDDSR